MNLCDNCGTANGELETECRICGHALAGMAAPAETAAPPAASESPPTSYAAADSAPELQISSVRQSMRTGAPPMLGNAGTPDPVTPDAAQKSALPSFMQEGARAQAPAPEPVNLISANDLPEWIRQIAEADAAKAEAEAAASARQTADAPAPIAKRSLPGTESSTAPSTTWLSKSSAAAETVDHWAAESPAATEPAQPAYPTITPSHTYMPSLHELSAASAKKRKLGRNTSAGASGAPVYRNRLVQLAALVLLLALLAAMVL